MSRKLDQKNQKNSRNMSNPNRNQQIENNQPEMQREAKTHARNTNLKCKQNLKPSSKSRRNTSTNVETHTETERQPKTQLEIHSKTQTQMPKPPRRHIEKSTSLCAVFVVPHCSLWELERERERASERERERERASEREREVFRGRENEGKWKP